MEECLFCKIASGQIPAEKVYEDNDVIAFLDINPRNPGHTLVIPKKHYETLLDMSDDDVSKLFVAVKKVAAGVKEVMKADGVSISQSNGRAAGQVVIHAHVHVIPRFMSEAPPGLESILPAKRLDQESMKKIAGAVRDGINAQASQSSYRTENRTGLEDDKRDLGFDF